MDEKREREAWIGCERFRRGHEPTRMDGGELAAAPPEAVERYSELVASSA